MNTLKHILCIGALWCLALTASAIDYPTYRPRINEVAYSQAQQSTLHSYRRHSTADSPFQYDISIHMSSTSAYGTGGDTPGNNGPSNGAPRRVYEPGVKVDGNGHYWDADEEAWLPIPGLDPIPQVGDTKYEGGIEYTWNGSAWVVSSNEVNNPIGSLPFLLMLLLCGGYVVMKKRKESNLA